MGLDPSQNNQPAQRNNNVGNEQQAEMQAMKLVVAPNESATRAFMIQNQGAIKEFYTLNEDADTHRMHVELSQAIRAHSGDPELKLRKTQAELFHETSEAALRKRMSVIERSLQVNLRSTIKSTQPIKFISMSIEHLPGKNGEGVTALAITPQIANEKHGSLYLQLTGPDPGGIIGSELNKTAR